MRKKMILFFLVSVLLLLDCSQQTYAGTRKKKSETTTRDYGYQITSYGLNIDVSKDNVYHVTEKLDVRFGKKFSEMKCQIQKNNLLTLGDDSKFFQDVKIENVKCQETDISVSEGKEDYILSLKEKKKHYTISYDYKVKNRVQGKYDYFFYPVLNHQWDAQSMEDFTLHVQMPEKVERSSVSVLGNSQGDQVFNSMRLSVKENVIYMYMQNKMPITEKEQILMAVKLKGGYFQKNTEDFVLTYVPIGVFVIASFLLFLSFLYWRKIKSTKHIQTYIINDPPEGFHCAEAAYIYEGEIQTTEVGALVLELAQKGYLEIKEDDRYGREAEFALVKKKEYDGESEEERVFFNAIFKEKDYVKNNDVFNSFYHTSEQVGEMVRKEYEGKVFEKDNRMIRKASVGLSIILGLVNLLVGFDVIQAGEWNLLFIGAAVIQMVLYGVLVSILLICIHYITLRDGSGKFNKRTLIPSVLCVIALNIFFWKLKGMYYFVFLYMLLVQILVLYLSDHSVKRTEYGENMYERVAGFHAYLDSVSKEQVNDMIQRNQDQFSKVLPYLFVFQLDGKWKREFGDLTIQLPEWFKKINGDSMEQFGQFLTFLGIVIMQMNDSITD